MAGISWIKIETTLPRKPVVFEVAVALGVSDLEVVGALVNILCWADGVTSDGVIGKGGLAIIDRIGALQGLGEALLEAGWLQRDRDGVVSFVEWDKHNGECAKRRATIARSVAKHKAKNAVNKNDYQGKQKCLPQDEEEVNENDYLDKIREDKNIARSTRAGAREFVTSGEDGEAAPPAPPKEALKVKTKGANALCMAWPKRTFCNETIRAVYASCLAEGITHGELMECLRLAKLSKQWEEQDGRFIPTLDKWLHERRFEGDLKRVRAEKRQRDEKRRTEQAEAEINALIYGDYDDEEAE